MIYIIIHIHNYVKQSSKEEYKMINSEKNLYIDNGNHEAIEIAQICFKY